MEITQRAFSVYFEGISYATAVRWIEVLIEEVTLNRIRELIKLLMPVKSILRLGNNCYLSFKTGKKLLSHQHRDE